jgi:hypothetical protein
MFVIQRALRNSEPAPPCARACPGTTRVGTQTVEALVTYISRVVVLDSLAFVTVRDTM